MDIFRLMNDIDGLDLSANELAVLFKIITRLNRNYWKPVRINQKDATGRMHKETFFTVRKAISEQGLILYLPGKWKTDAPRV